MEKEQQQKERLLSDYLILIEIPVNGLGYDAIQIINAARYFTRNFFLPLVDSGYQPSCVFFFQG